MIDAQTNRHEAELMDEHSGDRAAGDADQYSRQNTFVLRCSELTTY